MWHDSVSLVGWRKGCTVALVSTIADEAEKLPPYDAGRGRGQNWKLPPLTALSAPVRCRPDAIPALLSVYEEYIDRYLVSNDFDKPPRRWLHDNIPASKGVLDFVFPIIEGSDALYAVDILLIRLIWMIRQCSSLASHSGGNDLLVMTTIGLVGLEDGIVHYRFKPGVRLQTKAGVATSLAAGYIRVFNRALQGLHKSLSQTGQAALATLVTRLQVKPLLRSFYDDGTVTGGYLSGMSTVDDRILSIEFALYRSKCPADTLRNILVPEVLTTKDYRHLFSIPWKRSRRDEISSDYLIKRMPLLRKVLEAA